MKFLKPIVEKHDYFTGWTTVPGELLTEKERERRFRYLSDDVFVPVYVSKKFTYKIFGVRFQYEFEDKGMVIFYN